MNTLGLGAGSYPEPNEVYEEEDDYFGIEDDWDYADEYHELEMLGLI